MKRIFSVLLIAVMLMAMTPMLVMGAGPVRVVVNGSRISFPDAQPYLDDNNRVQVPVRFVSEALDGTVTWDGADKTVTIKRGTDVVTIKIGEKKIRVNGAEKTLDTEAVLNQDRTFVPVRFVSEALGAAVSWDESNYTAYIDIPLSAELVEKYGYLVPNNTNIGVGPASGDENMEAILVVNILRDNWDQQISDLYNAFKGKFGEGIAAEIRDHVQQKADRWYLLPEKFIYVKETDQYIWIQTSGGSAVSIYVCMPGYEDSGWRK